MYDLVELSERCSTALGGVRRKLVVLFATFALSGSAFAADLPLPVKAPPLPPASGWTGCYVGAEGGGACGKDAVNNAGPPGALGANVATIFPQGGLVGGTVGCNYQIRDWVVGIEDDLSWTSFSRTAADQPPFNPAFSQSVQTTWLDTLRIRSGIVVANSLLLYGTGGAAFTNIKDSTISAPPVVALSNTYTATGWTVGAGSEYRLNPQWSVKAEYLYMQFGWHTDNFFGLNPRFVNLNTQLNENVVRVGINYKFGLGLPTVTNY